MKVLKGLDFLMTRSQEHHLRLRYQTQTANPNR
ncbi:uncharacterized protein METZ01_LOCUS207678 [marine metagenome]|uniref:Uncharacterized protein n=1 Tax=marine metagenome TaxID=408172 RepID=A0A382EXK1_9ZZZZ